MGKNKNPLSLFITDNGAAIFGGKITKDSSNAIYGQISLPTGVIENGYIRKPEILLSQLKIFWKENQIKPRYIRLVIQDQNVLTREFVIRKKDLEKKSIEDYFYNQIGKVFHVPFEKPVISYLVTDETALSFSVLLYIADENLLHDYYDVLERLGIKDIIFDLAISALMEIAEDTEDAEDFKKENVLIVSLYDKLISIQIIEKNKLIFGAIEECGEEKEKLKKVIPTIIERIANYYQYNLRKGKESINRTIVFNLNDNLSSPEIKENIFPDLKDLNIQLYYSESIHEVFKDLPKGSLVAFGSNEFLLRRQKDKKIIDFVLKRVNHLKLLGYYIFVMGITLFASIALIYIPFHQNREEITNDTYRNEALKYQLELLQSYIVDNNTDSNNSEFLSAYNLVRSKQDDVPITYYEDLVDLLPSSITITDFSFDINLKIISITINSEDTDNILNYILEIYEEFGVNEQNLNQNQWIIEVPSNEFIADGVCEVIIYYA